MQKAKIQLSTYVATFMQNCVYFTLKDESVKKYKKNIEALECLYIKYVGELLRKND